MRFYSSKLIAITACRAYARALIHSYSRQSKDVSFESFVFGRFRPIMLS